MSTQKPDANPIPLPYDLASRLSRKRITLLPVRHLEFIWVNFGTADKPNVVECALDARALAGLGERVPRSCLSRPSTQAPDPGEWPADRPLFTGEGA